MKIRFADLQSSPRDNASSQYKLTDRYPTCNNPITKTSCTRYSIYYCIDELKLYTTIFNSWNNGETLTNMTLKSDTNNISDFMLYIDMNTIIPLPTLLPSNKLVSI